MNILFIKIDKIYDYSEREHIHPVMNMNFVIIRIFKFKIKSIIRGTALFRLKNNKNRQSKNQRYKEDNNKIKFIRHVTFV
tara:strand:- start:7383 stop:7622 length:240 start_codon:yes stop_codon:yes gene_type:complete